MNKFTKLLSVFVIAGAVSTGVAALAGCNSAPEHTHSATKHEAVAATCTQTGTKEYYTCDGSDCEGKYFEDEACTTEVTLESLTIAALGHSATKVEAKDPTCTQDGNEEYYTCSGTECEGKKYTDATCTTEKTDVVVEATGHTEKYTDKGDGTHGITCEKGDLTETTAPHADEDHDGKCDACEADVDGVYVAEVSATCTVEGTKAHYIKGDGSDGKLYSDVNCTTEVTAESLVIEKLPHTYIEYTTDKTYAKHSSSCDECGTKVTEDCVDEDKDGKCDVCGGDVSFLANAFAPAAYANIDNGIELVIAEDGTVSYVPGSGSSAKSGTLTKVNAYTATFSYEFRGETVNKTLIMTKAGLTIDDYVLEVMPEEIVSSIAEFCGVFKGDITYSIYGSTYHVTEFGMDGNGMIIFTQTEIVDGVESAALTTLKDGTYSEVKYNNFMVEGISFIATEVDNEGYVTKINLKVGDTEAIFTVDDAAGIPEVPAELPLDLDTYYVDATGDYTITVLNSGTTQYIYNGYVMKLISENAEGYLIYVYENGYKNYVLDVASDKSSIVLKSTSGTEIATLNLSQQTFPTLKAGENTGADVDVFNDWYACYQIDKTGWYTITAASDMNVYTKVEDHQYLLDGRVALTAGKATTIELTAGALLGVDSGNASVKLTVDYSENEPEPDYASFTDGKYVITSFNSADVYYVKGTSASAGKYYVSVVSSNTFDKNDRGAYFEIGGTKYGYTYSMSTFKWSQAAGGLVYEATLEVGAEVKVKVGCDNQWLALGDVTVYFETEEEYNARINGSSSGGGSEETTDIFSATQIGTYVYEKGKNLTFAVEANQITMSGGQYGYGTYNPTITKSGDTYTLSYMGYKLVFSFNAEGNIAVTSDTIYDYGSFVAVKQTSAGATFEGFTAEQQGAYTYTDSNGITVTITLNADKTVTYKITYNGSEEFPLTFDSCGTNTYVFKDANGNTITFSLGTDTVEVASGSKVLFGGILGAYTATKVAESAFEGFTAEQQGTYTYYDSSTYNTTFYITLGENTVNYKVAAKNVDLTFVSVTDGIYKFECADGLIQFTLGTDQLTVIGCSLSFANALTGKTATKVAESSGTTFEGFAVENQGTYLYEGDYEGNAYTITLTVGTDTVSYIFNNGKTSMTYNLTYMTESNGAYVFAENDLTVTFTFYGAVLYVSEDTITTVAGAYNANILAVVGDNAVLTGRTGSAVVIFNVAGTYTITYDGTVNYIEVDGTVVANGGTFTVTDSSTITVYGNNGGNTVVNFAIAESTGSSEEGGETGGATTFEGFTAEQQGTYKYSGVARYSYVIGENTISTDFYGPFVLSFASYENGEYTFTGSDSHGMYTFVFKFDESGNMYIITDTMHGVNKYTATKA